MGGAVSITGYTQVFVDLLIQGVKLKVFTHNSAPVRLEYIEGCLNKTLKHAEKPFIKKVLKSYYNNILNIVNEDDLLNNLIIKITNKVDTFGLIGRYGIIEGEDKLEKRKVLYYVEEHINVKPVREIKLAGL